MTCVVWRSLSFKRFSCWFSYVLNELAGQWSCARQVTKRESMSEFFVVRIVGWMDGDFVV